MYASFILLLGQAWIGIVFFFFLDFGLLNIFRPCMTD